jgi:translation initiation factor 1
MPKLTCGEGWSLSPDDRVPQPIKKENPASPKPKIRLERRTGKYVTVITGLHTYGAERLNSIAKELKAGLGTGGTVKNGQIEIQGDQMEPVKAWFLKCSPK